MEGEKSSASFPGKSSDLDKLGQAKTSLDMTARQLSVSALLLAGFLWLSNASGTLPENTGAPDELTCGRAPCHNIPPTTGTGQAGIDVNGGLPAYRAGWSSGVFMNA